MIRKLVLRDQEAACERGLSLSKYPTNLNTELELFEEQFEDGNHNKDQAPQIPQVHNTLSTIATGASTCNFFVYVSRLWSSAYRVFLTWSKKARKLTHNYAWKSLRLFLAFYRICCLKAWQMNLVMLLVKSKHLDHNAEKLLPKNLNF